MRDLFFAGALVLTCGVGDVAAGQETLGNPPPPAPGGAQTTTAHVQSSLYGGYGDPQVSSPTNLGRRAGELGADVDLQLRRDGPRLDFSLGALSNLRRYGSVNDGNFWSHFLKADLNTRLSARTGFSAYARGDYTESLTLNGRTAPGSAMGDGTSQATVLQLGAGRRPTTAFGGGANFRRDLTTRSSFLVGIGSNQTRTLNGPETRTVDHRSQVQFMNQFRRRAGFQVGYSYRQSSFNGPTVPLRHLRQHGLNFGFDRQWVHSATRQSALRVSAGPSMVLGRGPRRYVATVDVAVDGQFSRSWFVTIAAGRDMSFVDGIARPFLAHAFRGQVRGQLTRRFDIVAFGSASTGSARFDSSGSSYTSRSGSLRFEWEATRVLVLYTEYVFRRYVLTNLPVGSVLGSPNRSSVRVGVMWQVPLKGGGTKHGTR